MHFDIVTIITTLTTQFVPVAGEQMRRPLLFSEEHLDRAETGCEQSLDRKQQLPFQGRFGCRRNDMDRRAQPALASVVRATRSRPGCHAAAIGPSPIRRAP